jgi:hypothetical protein
MVRIHLPPARSQQRTLWLPGASHAGGTQSSNPLCSSGESDANLSSSASGRMNPRSTEDRGSCTPVRVREAGRRSRLCALLPTKPGTRGSDRWPEWTRLTVGAWQRDRPKQNGICVLPHYKGGTELSSAASHWYGGNGRFSGHEFRLRLIHHLRKSPELAGQNQSDTAGGDGAKCACSPDRQFVPPKIVEEGYHLSEDLADDAIGWLHKHKAFQPEKPFFMCTGRAARSTARTTS